MDGAVFDAGFASRLVWDCYFGRGLLRLVEGPVLLFEVCSFSCSDSRGSFRPMVGCVVGGRRSGRLGCRFQCRAFFLGGKADGVVELRT